MRVGGDLLDETRAFNEQPGCSRRCLAESATGPVRRRRSARLRGTPGSSRLPCLDERRRCCSMRGRGCRMRVMVTDSLRASYLNLHDRSDSRRAEQLDSTGCALARFSPKTIRMAIECGARSVETQQFLWPEHASWLPAPAPTAAAISRGWILRRWGVCGCRRPAFPTRRRRVGRRRLRVDREP